ncbi:MAG: hypothetical protein WAT79_12310 [Saprospiraceae bacterium]
MLHLNLGKLTVLSFFTFAYLVSLGGQTIGSKEKNEGEHLGQKQKLFLLNPSYERWSGDKILSTWSTLNDFKVYNPSARNTTLWEIVGPKGHISGEGFDFVCSGRVRDVEILSDHHIRVVSASGGLWEIKTDEVNLVSTKNLSGHAVLTTWGGTVATDPNDKNIILYGTGEPGVRAGTGLWRTTNGGDHWEHIPINGGIGMGAFDEMEFTNIPSKVWTSGSDGVFFSENSGLTWAQKWGGNCQGMVIFPDNPNIVLVGDLYRGIYKTTNGGNSWIKKTSGLPSSDFARIELSNCRNQPHVIYALYTSISGFTLGIYKSTDSGETWLKCEVSDANGVKNVDYHWGMANYCSFIAVSPTNPNHVISGGGWYVYSADGFHFTGPTEGQHADFHTGGWSKDGSKTYVGNDGGIYKTLFDFKWKWDHTINQLPITQFLTLAVARNQSQAIIGGTQDNGFVYYVPAVKKWFYQLGDGGGVAFHPYNDELVYGTIGLFGGSLTFRNFYKRGSSATGWRDSNFGLDNSGQWWRLVRTDRNNPPMVYTQTDNKVYFSENNGDHWHKFVTDNIPINSIESMRVSLDEIPKIYVTGNGVDTSQCMMLDAVVWEWTNITQGLPIRTNTNEYSVPHVYVSENPSFPDRVYALMRGHGEHLVNEVLFKSDTNGFDWENISGNLPELPFTVMMEHPLNDQILVVGTDGFGAFITDDGGKNWKKWDDGLVKGSFITDFDYQKISSDSVFIVMSTYGQSIWKRLLPNEGIVAIQNIQKNKFDNIIQSCVNDGQQCDVSFNETLTSGVTLEVCNIGGICVLNQQIEKGISDFKLDIQSYPSGMYVISINQNNRVVGTAKMIKN